MSNRYVIDASALLALLNDEPGADAVRAAVISGSIISSVNLCEVIGKLIDIGMSPDEVFEVIAPLGLQVEEFDTRQAYEAGLLRQKTQRTGLSLGDRACMALAIKLGLPIVTADRAWVDVDVPVEVRLIRE